MRRFVARSSGPLNEQFISVASKLKRKRGCRKMKPWRRASKRGKGLRLVVILVLISRRFRMTAAFWQEEALKVVSEIVTACLRQPCHSIKGIKRFLGFGGLNWKKASFSLAFLSLRWTPQVVWLFNESRVTQEEGEKIEFWHFLAFEYLSDRWSMSSVSLVLRSQRMKSFVLLLRSALTRINNNNTVFIAVINFYYITFRFSHFSFRVGGTGVFMPPTTEGLPFFTAIC